MLRFAPEGYPFIGGFILIAAGVWVAFGPRAAIVPLVLVFFMFFFFRDPERTMPSAEGFLSPADGRIISITPQYEGKHIKGETLKISIFMSPFNVHVNRAPCDGKVLNVLHTPGSFKAAFSPEAGEKNENTAMLMQCGSHNVLVRQIAGFLARRTVNRATPGDVLKRGQKFGIIKFSSRLDVFLPSDVQVNVSIDDRVRAGESLLATLGEGK